MAYNKAKEKRSVLTIGRFSIQTDGTISVCRNRVHTLMKLQRTRHRPK